MDEALVGRYWCHMCSQIVNPVMELVDIKCPRCNGGFIEEMDDGGGERERERSPAASDLNSDRDLSSLWDPILLGMLSDGLRRRSSGSNNDSNPASAEQEERELMSVIRRRQRTSAILEVLNDLQERLQLESDNPGGERERERQRQREHMVLINPFTQAIIIHGAGENQGLNQQIGASSLGDYIVGPGLEQLLQHLAENDPNRQGTLPASKEAVEAMPAVRIEEQTSCYVCLEDFEIGEEAREMPCKHRFHGACILPWLRAHSSCPVCRYQLQAEEPKDSNVSGNRDEGNGGGGGEGESGGNGRRFWLPLPWPFSGFFSLSQNSGNGGGSGNSSSAPTSSSPSGGNSDEN